MILIAALSGDYCLQPFCMFNPCSIVWAAVDVFAQKHHVAFLLISESTRSVLGCQFKMMTAPKSVFALASGFSVGRENACNVWQDRNIPSNSGSRKNDPFPRTRKRVPWTCCLGLWTCLLAHFNLPSWWAKWVPIDLVVLPWLRHPAIGYASNALLVVPNLMEK